jgi:hypothetical protein
VSRLKNTLTRSVEIPVGDATVVHASFANISVREVDSNSYTEKSYDCYVITCHECDHPILYIVDPEYSLAVGINHGVPVELTFTKLPVQVINHDLTPIFSNDRLWSDTAYEITCFCGHKNIKVLGQDHKSFYEDMTLVRCSHATPIPKNRLPFIKEPKSEWDVNNKK